MLKVLHITWSAHFGGIEKLLLEVCREQKKSALIEPSVYFGKPSGEMLELFQAENIQIELGTFRNGMDFSPARYSQVKSTFSKYDILHFHIFNPLMARAAAKSGKIIFYTEHGNFGFGRKSSATDTLLLRLRSYFLNKYVNKLLFNSKFTASHANAIMNLEKVNQQVLYNGVSQYDEPALPPEDIAAQTTGYFVIGTAARFARFKRLHLILEAFAKAHGKSRAKLLFIGDGPLRQELETLTHRLEIASQVIFTGYRNDVAAVGALIDVFVVPSENEPFGLTVIENLSRGIPVLVMKDGGGARELVEQIEPDNVCADVEQLALKFSQFIKNGNEIGEKGGMRRKFAHRFTIQEHTNQLEILYGKAANVRN